MAIRRYSRTPLLQGNKFYATPGGIVALRKGVASGVVSTVPYVTSDAERLDTIAGRKYGNGKLWWIIAAASNIGWALQVPPGTRLLIPRDLNQVNQIVGM